MIELDIATREALKQATDVFFNKWSSNLKSSKRLSYLSLWLDVKRYLTDLQSLQNDQPAQTDRAPGARTASAWAFGAGPAWCQRGG